MSIVSLSDLHYSHKYPESKKIWNSFISHPDVVSADTVILLGDIFDLMIGGKTQYIKYYDEFFQSIKLMIENGKKIIFVEGNHDFHLERVFSKFKRKYGLDVNSIEYHKDEFKMKCYGEDILFCHGDLVDSTNESFKKWKSIYRNKAFEFFTNNILPFFILKKVGEKASKDSKKRNSRVFNYEKAKELYRSGACEVLSAHKVDYLVAGHTHIIDNFKSEFGVYLNNGFPVKDQTFISIHERGIELVSLTDSCE